MSTPAVSSLPDLQAGATLDQVTAWLQQLRTLMVAREPLASGSSLNKFVTRGELVNLDILTYSGGVGSGIGIGGGSGFTEVGGTAPDLSAPTPISGLTVSGLLTHFFIEFDPPTYPQGGGNAYTEIYAANYSGTGPLPTFADAVLIYEVTGPAFIAAVPAQPAQNTHFWAGAVTEFGIRQVDGVGPTGGINGVSDTTAVDVSSLLTALNGKITESQLFASLGARIDLIDAPSTTLGSVAARILAEATARGTAITTEATTRSSADSALSTSITTLTASTSANAAAISTETTARTSGDSALASSISTLATQVGTNTSAISTEATTRASADSALSTLITALTSTVSGNTAAISTEATTRASADSAISSTVSTLSSTVGANTTAISTEASTRAAADGSLFSQYTVKIDTNEYVTGFGLASTATGAAPTSSFIVRADDFTVASPTGPGITPVTPFVVTTTPTTINGVAVPVGVYMNAAFIQNGTITSAKIGELEVDDAKIVNLDGAKINAASVTATQLAANSITTVQLAANSVTASAILAGTITASKLSVTSLDAITATIGTLRTASSGGRSEIADNVIRVYDTSNVLRVKIGYLL